VCYNRLSTKETTAASTIFTRYSKNNTFMNHFPVSSATLSATHLGLFLQQQYNFSGNTSCRIIKAGVNHTYQVNDGASKFVFRVYSLHWRTKTEIAEEIRLINLLKEDRKSVV
jgi:Ser/Thr protein kinase RdoA (MazF antagonist)